jgi:pimeloyl-ACP methyl ester carboxylesterase
MQLRQEESPVDGTVHQQNISLLLSASTATTQTAFGNGYPGFYSPGDNYTYVASGITNPRATIIWDEAVQNIVIILNGMQNFDKVQQLIIGWADPSAAGTSVYCYPFENGAVALLNSIPVKPPGFNWQSVTIIGHSYGGAVAPWLAYHMNGISSNTNLKIYTYGAPKPSVNQIFGEQIVTNTRRVFQASDPVPCMPLGNGDASNVWAIQGVPTARAWARWRQYCSGLMAYPVLDGLAPADNPPYADNWSFFFSFASWVTGLNCFGAANHSLTSYYTAMLQVPAPPAPSRQPATGGPPPQPHSLSAVQIESRQAVAQAQLATVVASNPNGASLQAAANIPQVAGARFYGRRVNGVQTVLYNGEVVTTVGTLRVRRAVVRQMNRAAGY